LWQAVHEPVCGLLPSICGAEYVVFRSSKNGAWSVSGGTERFESVTRNHTFDAHALHQETKSGLEFISRLPVRRECVIATIVPTVATNEALAVAIARELGLTAVIPAVDGLITFDGSHLDRSSAERWSQAFFEAAEARINECLQIPYGS
jgi:hypothetical protein